MHLHGTNVLGNEIIYYLVQKKKNSKEKQKASVVKSQQRCRHSCFAISSCTFLE